MQKIKYSDLKGKSKQQEIYNFQKVSAIFADFGYTTIKLSNDWMGADFIAIAFEGEEYLKVQLKGRLSLSSKYQDKDIYICFPERRNGENDKWYLYPHDEVLKKIPQAIAYIKKHGGDWHSRMTKEQKEMLRPYLFE
jgi:hypothetical protein